ncbi:MAG TPA: hypothetical protein VF603_06575 [Allosphingosinicella sp.]|jgi:hypothetical protein
MRALWLLLLFASAPAAGQAQAPPEQVAICISHDPTWQGSGADVRAIETIPVPERYRRMGRSFACRRSSQMFHNLIAWHIGFGSERSTTAAFDYLEGYYSSGLPPAADYRRAVEQARRAALPALRRASREQDNGGYVGRLDLARESAAAGRLSALIDGAADYLYLAEYELLAAEEFVSLPLLDRAERHLRAISETLAFLAQPEVAASVAPLLEDEFEPFRIDDLRVRAAVWRAYLTRAPADLVRAEMLVDAAERPNYRRLAETVMGGRDACAIDPEVDWDAANDACNAQQDLQARIVSWIVNRAKLDLIAGEDDQRNLNLAHELLLRGWGASSATCCRPAAADDLLRLRLMRAGEYRRQLDQTNDVFHAREHLTGAMFELEQALDDVSPVSAPARFRRIAEAWLQLWARADPQTELSGFSSAQDWQRYSVYLRALLDALPAIATARD